MISRTLRLLPDGATPSKATETRLRFIESTSILTVAGPDDLDLARSGSGCVLVSVLVSVLT